MLFNSIAFLVFAPVFFLLYFTFSGRARLLLILLSSYFFYAWWDWRFVSLLIISTVVDYSIGLMLEKKEEERARRTLLLVSLCSNLGILGTFKYFDFFSESLQSLFDSAGLSISTPVLDVVLPVGISFYTFQTLSYTIDVYRRRIGAEKDLLCFASYVALFPQLVAGPIVRAADLLPQLHINHSLDFSRVGRGLEMIAWGFFLKLCLADTAATVVDPRFNAIEYTGAVSHLIGVFSFSFQIYGDFAGYSLIAIGLGRIMGFDFGINFNRPYFSVSFSEFWTRWHISLSSWLRDYLYISLGGNRGGTFLTYRNLLITMLLGGLWHGAGWAFIVWGALHGMYLVLQRIVGPYYGALVNVLKVPELLSRSFLIIMVFSLTSFAWIFFRADNFDDAMSVITIIAEFDNTSIGAGDQLIGILKTFIFVMIVVLVDALSLVEKIRTFYFSNTGVRLFSVMCLIWTITLLGTFEGASFLYFQF